MNMNKLAKLVADREGKKVSVNIAQIKEVLRITLAELADADPADVLVMLRKCRCK